MSVKECRGRRKKLTEKDRCAGVLSEDRVWCWEGSKLSSVSRLLCHTYGHNLPISLVNFSGSQTNVTPAGGSIEEEIVESVPR